MEKKKKFKMPGSYVLIFYILVFVWLLTFIIPSGTYENVVDAVSGKEVMDPNSFHYIVDDEPVSFMDFLLSIPNGMTENNKTIFLVVLSGGAFGVILATGARPSGSKNGREFSSGRTYYWTDDVDGRRPFGGRKCKCSVCATWTVGSTKT